MEQQEKKDESKIIIPGINDNKENIKKPIIMEVGGSDKYRPNFTLKHLDETNQVQFIFQVDEEKSAKEIDLDVSDSAIKLNSPK